MKFFLALPRRAVVALFGATLLLSASLVACSSDQITGMKAPTDANSAIIGGLGLDCPVPSVALMLGVPIVPMVVTGTGPSTLSLLVSGLPAGLTMSATTLTGPNSAQIATAIISGTPTAGGTFNYTLTLNSVRSTVKTNEQACSLTVGYPSITASCVNISGVAGSPIAPVTLVASGGSGTGYTFSATGLPAGLSMASNGTISGTPTAGGSTTSYSVTITDSAGNTVTLTMNCPINIGYPPITASCAAITGVMGTAIAPVSISAAGGSGAGYTYSASGLPAGLTMAADGTISGTPTVGGSFTYTVTVTDNAGNSYTTTGCTITIGYPPIGASCSAISGVMGSAITPVSVAATGGSGAGYSYSASGLPAGLSMASNGTISGTPTIGGSFTYTVTVTDNAGNSYTTTGCTITIGYPPIGASCSAISGVMGSAITPVSVAATGGSGAGYSYSASGLPAGLSMAADGTISGTPTVGGSFTYTVTVTDNAGNSYTTTGCTITIGYPPIGASCSAISGVMGSAITPVSVAATGGSGAGYTYTASGLPAGLTMAADGTISGTPTVGGSFTYTVTVTDNAGNSYTMTGCTITIGYPPIGASCSAISGVMGSAITPVSVAATGGSGAGYSYSASGLPAGLSMASNGTISGTPTVGGSFTYTVTVTDNAGNSYTTTGCTITIGYPPIGAACSAISGVMGSAITPVSVAATGGSGAGYSYSASGLPAGLTMASNGTISGTPTVGGSFTYTVTVTDNAGNSYTTTGCTITIGYPPIGASCSAISGVMGSAITPVSVAATGGSGAGYSYSASGLPAGLTMASNGTISGTPTVGGSFTYTVTVTDSAGNSYTTAGCTITIGYPPINASCVSISAVLGTPIPPVAVDGSGGSGAGYTFAATGLPAGLSMNSSGQISGTPTAFGTFAYTVTVTDGAGNIKTLNCSVTVATPPIASSCVAITAVRGTPIASVTLAATGGSGTGYTFSATGLPAGVTMAANGTISGTPTVGGTFNYTVTITDSAGNTATLNCSVTVTYPPISSSCVSISAVKGTAITPVTLAATGGSGTGYTFAATGLPAGLTMAANGTISGTPTVGGTFNYTVTITDSAGNTKTLNCSLTVTYPPITATCLSISAMEGKAITPATLVAAGGSGTGYTYSASGLPAGLTMAANGTISGTPAADGTFSYTVTITDSAGNTKTINCTIVVTPKPDCDCATVTAEQGVAMTAFYVTGSGGAGGPYTFTATGLPAGVTITSAGKISGTPTVNGTFNYTITVTDKNGNKSTINCTIVVSPPPSCNCETIDATKGVPITPVQVDGIGGGHGGPYTFTATGLPAGLVISTSGVISGTPTVTGTFAYTITVTDKYGHKSTINCSVNVKVPPTPPTTSCVSISAVVGNAITPVNMVGASGAGAPYTFTATGLPTGLSISSSGTISGTPTVAGTFSYTVTVKDKNGVAGTLNCSITVNAAPTAACASLSPKKGVAITPVTLVASGGGGAPYTFSATGLPAGLSISSTGTISGTSTVSGTFGYTVTITDKNGKKGTINCQVIVVVNTADTVAPTCAVFANASPAYMTYQDGGSGIVRLDVITNLNSNYKIGISPVPTGTTYSNGSNNSAIPTNGWVKFPTGQTGTIKVTATRINTRVSAQLTVKATDGNGNTVTCDPIETTVMKMKNDDGDQTFDNVPWEEHFVTIENGGLRAIDIDVNGTVFKVKRLDDDEKRVVDISSAMKKNGKNTITLSPKGKKGETADITIGPDPDN